MAIKLVKYMLEIQKYESEHLNREPRLKVEPYDLKIDWPASKQIACAEEYGVYAFFNENGELLRVGKASNNSSLGKRIDSYFHRQSDELGARPKDSSWTGNHRPRFSYSTPTEHAFEAPSLEEYLIYKLQPPLNIVGKRN